MFGLKYTGCRLFIIQIKNCYGICEKKIKGVTTTIQLLSEKSQEMYKTFK